MVERQPLAQGAGERVRGQPPDGGEFRARVEEAFDHHRQSKIAAAVRPGPEEPVQLEPAGGTQDRRHVAVRPTAHDLERRVESQGAHGLPPQQPTKSLDALGGPGREIGQGAVLDAATVAVALAQQDGGRGGPIGDGHHVHDCMMPQL